MDFEEMRNAYLRANGIQDDIVIRLRTSPAPTRVIAQMLEAADEIERLRTELANKQ